MKRKKAIRLYKNHFSLIWKSQSVSFNKAVEKLESNFKLVEIFLTEENVKY